MCKVEGNEILLSSHLVASFKVHSYFGKLQFKGMSSMNKVQHAYMVEKLYYEEAHVLLELFRMMKMSSFMPDCV